MITVSNTTPILSLSSIGKVELLRDLFQEIIIPQAVYDEIKAKKSYGYKEVESTFIVVTSVDISSTAAIPQVNALDIGEVETILLATALDADNTIIDENLGFKIAKESGLNVIRTLSILLKAKEESLIPKVKPLLDELVLNGRWYSKHVYYAFLEKAGEL